MVCASRWTAAQAVAWYSQFPWLVGCNFIPSSAINQLEMWQEDTFDMETIDHDLGLAQDLGMNSARVFLHNLAWSQDHEGFKARINTFLEIAEKRGIKPMLVLFDSCWNPEPVIGKQPETRVGLHNCGWLQAPGAKSEVDPTTWPELEKYVVDILTSFGQDSRILLWDLYNEPAAQALPLLKEVFKWAQAANPSQPITSGAFWADAAVTEFQLAASDVTTFHQYESAEELRKKIEELQVLGRPILCTEWMARTRGSRVQSNLPVFKELGVACYTWGLVYGKTQTIYPWGSEEGSPEPEEWFHDLFRADGSAYSLEEVETFRTLTSR